MRRSTRSNPNNGLTEPSAPEEIRFAHGVAEENAKNSDGADSK